MPEHVHMLVSEPSVQLLSTAIQALKISFFRRAVAIGWRQSPFWQKRYYDYNVRNPHSFTNKLRYIHRNPGGAAWSASRKTGCGVAFDTTSPPSRTS